MSDGISNGGGFVHIEAQQVKIRMGSGFLFGDLIQILKIKIITTSFNHMISPGSRRNECRCFVQMGNEIEFPILSVVRNPDPEAAASGALALASSAESIL